jgi:hypothetical protein
MPDYADQLKQIPQGHGNLFAQHGHFSRFLSTHKVNFRLAD